MVPRNMYCECFVSESYDSMQLRLNKTHALDLFNLQTPFAAPFMEKNLLSFQVDGRQAFIADTVLDAFKDWANSNLATIYNYDHAMMFT
ncbi:hypothetical protein DPMN_112624 [Dreissena polymorpha]|uniref:Uncharacterized protein n=1 Tax=Dreissena polymorpha TaxID=45954 RepID=A0A9D4KGR5_DREPO|nr:hypothetical protein DPMN_112624 [Dreissena polymorpha]